MSTGRYLLGAAELSVIAAALGLGAYHLRALLAPAWTGALARLAEVAIGISAAALVVIHWAHPTGQAVDQGMYYQDTTWYHMSFSARFAQTGDVGPLHFTDPLKLAAWFYPQNSELLHGIGIVFLKTDFLSPLINLMWVALCLLAAWCVGRPFAIGGVTVLGAAVGLDSEVMVGSPAGEGPQHGA